MNPVYIVRRSDNIQIKEVRPVYVVKRPNIVQFSVFNFAKFMPFNFVAIEDQVDFTLPAVPSAIWVFVNGTAQNGDKVPPDFVVTLDNLHIEGLDAGDNLYGMIQY